MKFREYLQEAVIVPKKIKITTNDINKLNKQFKDTIVRFDYDTGPHAAYNPQFGTVTVWIEKDTPHNVIEALIQHELIHVAQDKRSGGRMEADIEKRKDELEDILDELDDLDDCDQIDPAVCKELMQRYKQLQINAEHLNDEERMTYAYMFVKLRTSDNIKQVINKANVDWKKWTNQKMNKKMLKYFYSYWMIKDEL
jgi:hypothetical protein